MTEPVVVVPKTPMAVNVKVGSPSPVYVGPKSVGPAGPTGPTGPQGHGIPAGGVDGDFVQKTGAGDYEMGWAPLTEFVVIDHNGTVPPDTAPGSIVLARII